MFIKPLSEYDDQDLSGHTYYGVVVDNNDPKRLMRVRVRIPELFSDAYSIPDDHLPWSMQLRSPTMGGSSISHNIVPRVGSIVSVVFSNGDIYNPTYTGEPAALNMVSTGATSSNYPNVYNFTDPKGNTYSVDMVSNTLTFNFNGNVVGHVDGQVNLSVTGKVVGTASKWELTGDVYVTGNIHATGDIYDLNDTEGTVNHLREVYNIHTHGGVDSGPSNTQIPDQLV